jgi:hypothetical protein
MWKVPGLNLARKPNLQADVSLIPADKCHDIAQPRPQAPPSAFLAVR